MNERRLLARHPTRRRVVLLLAAAAVLLAAFVDIRFVEPRVHVRWRDQITPAQRTELERRYNLHRGERLQDTTWRYQLHDRSAANVGALVADDAVVDTAYIDRPTLAVPDRELEISAARLWAFTGPSPRQLLQLQSVLAFAGGGILLWAALGDDRRRRAAGFTVLAALAVAAYALPLRQAIRMGDSETYTLSRRSFENYTAVNEIRFEAHLSHAILGRLDALLGRTPDSPERALRLLMHAATAWFIVMAVVVGIVDSWSPVVMRYLGLALIAPSTLLYFGYLELGHLSLNVATFPLLVRGLRQRSFHIEASGALAGLGSALHGFGLLSVGGALLAIAFERVRLVDRLRAGARFLPWTVAAYIGWSAIYLIVLKLPIVAGHAESIPLRPLLTDEITDRVNAAILTARGARDVFATTLVVGMPLIVVAGSLWRRFGFEARTALLYALPSMMFVVAFWPIQGLAVEMDLVFAAFPAVYALAWVCAQDQRRALTAAALLAIGHLAFWRIVLDSAFVNGRV